MAKLVPNIRFREVDTNGDPLSGGKVYTYESGTTTPKSSYTDNTGATLNANPVILDSRGSADIWIDGTYKIVVTDSTGVTLYTTDVVNNDTGAAGAAGSIPMATAGGTADAITANYTPDVTLTNLTTVGFVATATNATTTPTFAPDGLTAYVLTKGGGSALVAGDIVDKGVYICTYRSANTRWEMANTSSLSAVTSVAGRTGVVTLAKADITDLSTATTTATGLIELATQSEVDAYTDATRAVCASTIPTGTILNTQVGTYTSSADLTTTIPADDTIPQSTEGTQLTTVTITPKSTTNKLKVTVSGFLSNSSSSNLTNTLAVFKDSTASALHAHATWTAAANELRAFTFAFVYTPGSISSTTLKLRAGPSSGTLRMNGTAASRLFGGVAAVTMIVEEIKA